MQKKTSKKIYLIIQGPLLSCGKTGRQDHEVVQYDCRDNIEKIIDYNKKYKVFSAIILCVWGNDPLVSYKFESITKKIIPDQFGEVYYQESDGRIKVNNKTRQWFSSVAGCRALIDAGVGEYEFVLKLRSDQFFDFRILIKFLDTLVQVDNQKLFVPFFSNKTKDGEPQPSIHLSDYYMFGKLNILMDFFNCQLRGPEYTTISHRDAFFRYVWAKCGEALKIPEKFYFMRSNKIFTQNKFAVEAGYSYLFHPLPRDCYMTMSWRGVEAKEAGQWQYKIFAEDWGCHSFKDAYLNRIKNIKRKINFFNFPFHIDMERLYELDNKNKILKNLINIYVQLFSLLGKFATVVRNHRVHNLVTKKKVNK